MSSTNDDPTDETYGEAELNERGRLTIPKDLRDDLQLEDGTTFTVVRDGNSIRLERKLPELQTLSSGKSPEEWAEASSLDDAGESTFGGR